MLHVGDSALFPHPARMIGDVSAKKEIAKRAGFIERPIRLRSRRANGLFREARACGFAGSIRGARAETGAVRGHRTRRTYSMSITGFQLAPPSRVPSQRQRR